MNACFCFTAEEIRLSDNINNLILIPEHYLGLWKYAGYTKSGKMIRFARLGSFKRKHTIAIRPTHRIAIAQEADIAYWTNRDGINPPARPPAWANATDRLSRTISEISLIIRQSNFDYEDAKAFYAPSECYHDIARATERAIKAALKRSGFTADDLIAEATDRTTARFIWDIGLSSVLDFAEG